MIDAIVKAIVHLNFDEKDEALTVLIGALSEFNFAEIKAMEALYGDRTAAN